MMSFLCQSVVNRTKHNCCCDCNTKTCLVVVAMSNRNVDSEELLHVGGFLCDGHTTNDGNGDDGDD